MEEKKTAKISVSTFFLIFAIIIIIIMGFFTFKFYNDKKLADEEIEKLNNQINTMESSITNLQTTIDNVSNALNNNSSNSNSKYSEITEELKGIDVLYVTDAIKNGNNYTLKGVIYTQYTLTDEECSSIVNKGSMVIDNETYTVKNSDSSNEYDLFRPNNQYPLYKIKESTSSGYYLECQAQIYNVWKLTDQYKQITVSGNTKVLDEYNENLTVEDLFSNYASSNPLDTTSPDASKTFKFKFENGKCTEVINAMTAV